MSSDHANRGFLPPSTSDITDQLHRQPPSSAAFPTGENPHRFTALPLPQTSPKTTSHPNNTAVENTTPESQLAAALGRAINAIPPTSFRDAVTATTTVNTQNPLRRTVSDASSSDYPQSSTITTTTPPKPPEPERKTPLRRTVSAPISVHHQEPEKTMTPAPEIPVARAVFPTTNPRTTPPESLNRKESPGFKRLRKIEETVRDIEQRCWDVMQECESGVAEQHIQQDNSIQVMVQEQVKEECVGFETLIDDGLRFRLSCSCGKRFEILLKDNGCFYKLT